MQNPIPKIGLVQGQRCERCIARFERWREEQRRKRRRGPRGGAWFQALFAVCEAPHLRPLKATCIRAMISGVCISEDPKCFQIWQCVWITWLGFNPQGHQFHRDSQEKQEWILELSFGNAGPSSQANLYTEHVGGRQSLHWPCRRFTFGQHFHGKAKTCSSRDDPR